MSDPVRPDQPRRVKKTPENLNVTPTSQVSLHVPDQPYTPSEDEVRAIFYQAYRAADGVEMFNRFIASVRREAQEEARREIARLTGTATIAAAIRRTAKGEND